MENIEQNLAQTPVREEISQTEKRPPQELNLGNLTGDYLQKSKYIDNLADFGVFSESQAQNLKQSLIKKMNNEFELKSSNDGIFKEFEVENPDFFKSRENLKNYLESVDVKLDKGEFNKIAKLIGELEEKAVLRYKSEFTRNEMLQKANRNALERLKTASYNSHKDKVEGQKIFTAAEIGAMSSEEFRKFEKIINYQLAKGLIK